jgi:hypothetical protein
VAHGRLDGFGSKKEWLHPCVGLEGWWKLQIW